MSNAAEATEKKEQEQPQEQPPIDPKTASDFVAELIDGKKPEAKPEKKGAKPAEEHKEQEAGTSPAKDPATGKFLPRAKKPVKKSAPAPKEVDYEAIAEASARGVAKALEQKPQPQEQEKEKPKEVVTTHLTAEEKAKLPVLEKLAALHPDKYKGLAENFTQNIKAVADYQKKWEKENPGEEFDPEDKQHDEFFEEHTVDWNDEEYNEAVRAMERDAIREELRREFGGEVEELKMAEKIRALEPVAYRDAKTAGKYVFDKIGGVFKDIINDDLTMNRKAVMEAEEKDDLAAEIVLPEVTQLERRAQACSFLFGGLKFDKDNPYHQFVSDFAMKAEEEMLALPKEKQVQDGKKFLTSAQYHKLPKHEQSRYYTFSAKDLNRMMAAETAARLVKTVNKERERLKARAVKYGYLKQKPEDNPFEKEEPEDKPAPVQKPRPVGMGSDAITPATVGNRDHKPQNPASALLQELL